MVLKYYNSSVPNDKFTKQVMGKSITLCLIPLIISLVSTIFFTDCLVTNDIAFYFLISITSYLLGMVSGFFSFHLSEKRPGLIFFVIFIYFLFIPLYELYTNPQVYFYSILIGYFPGNIYDEYINIPNNLIYFSTSTLIVSALFISLTKLISRRKKYLSKIFILSALAAYFFIKPLFWFSTTESGLTKTLGAKIETEHFSLVLPSNLKEHRIKNLALEHEFCYSYLADSLGYKPSEKITSWIFKDRKMKKEYFGAGNADVSKPWQYMIFIQNNTPGTTILHELAHVFSAEKGRGIFKLAENFNPAMIEGYAMLVENNFDDFDLFHTAAFAKHAGYFIDPASLYSGFNFFTSNTSLSYALSGAFLKFISLYYGMETVNKLYSDMDFEKYTGKNIEELSRDYEEFINTIEPDTNKHRAQLYFARPPLVKKFCPRYVARKMEEAKEEFYRGKYEEALEMYKDLLNRTDNYSSLRGLVNTYIKMDSLDRAMEYAGLYNDRFKGASYEYAMELLLGEIYSRRGMPEQAAKYYDRVMEQNPSKNYYNYARFQDFITSNGKNYFAYLNDISTHEKLKILAQHNRISFSPETAPELVRLLKSELEEEPPDSLHPEFLERPEVRNSDDFYLLFEISEYYTKIPDFDNAEYFAERALRKCENKANFAPLKYNLQKIRWMKKNHLEIWKGMKRIEF